MSSSSSDGESGVYPDDYYVPLPSDVREWLSDYSSDSPPIHPLWEEFDTSRFDDLINGVETSPRVRLMQEAARGLRQHVVELENDVSWGRDRIEDLTREVQQELTNVGYLDDMNQQLVEQVFALATSNVQLALGRDNLLTANIRLLDVSKGRLYYGWVVTVLLALVIIIGIFRSLV